LCTRVCRIQGRAPGFLGRVFWDRYWGANLPGSPVVLDDSVPETETISLVPVARWSDGTAAPIV